MQSTSQQRPIALHTRPEQEGIDNVMAVGHRLKDTTTLSLLDVDILDKRLAKSFNICEDGDCLYVRQFSWPIRYSQSKQIAIASARPLSMEGSPQFDED